MAGLDEETYEYMCEKYPDYRFQEAVDRYVGFIFMDAPAKSKVGYQLVQQSESIPTDSFIILMKNTALLTTRMINA